MSVFHLKYRPQKVADLDLPEVSKFLEKLLKQEEKPQSFLLSGPKGSGKTSSARILARAVNCLRPEGVEPCGECENCQEILKGTSMDVIEIDGASNRGIEDVRSLKEGAYLSPSKLKVKVFIIDEVHMLTKEAFNALLKLIEEPPKKTMFLLCTTDPEKIPETVLSRLTRVDFRKGKLEELESSLNRTIAGEKIEIGEGAKKMLIMRSDGSFRNIQRWLNEIVFNYGRKISEKEVEEYITTKSGDFEGEEMEAMLTRGEITEILSRMEKMAEKGVDFRSFRERLVDYFQKKLLSFYGLGGGEAAKGMTKDEVVRWINLLITAGKIEKEVPISQLPLQLAVVEFLKNKGVNPPDSAKASSSSFDKEGKADDSKVEVDTKTEEVTVADDSFTVTVEQVETSWGQLLMTIKPYNHSVEAFLRAARPLRTKGRTIYFEVFYPFHKERLEEARNRKVVETCLKKVFGGEMGFECVLAKNKKAPLVINNDTPAEKVNENLVASTTEEKKDIYDVAKEIFG